MKCVKRVELRPGAWSPSSKQGIDILAKLKYKALSKVDRYAVVGAKPWMRNFLELLAPMFSTQIRVFEPSDEAAAWEWVGAQQALLAEKSA